MQQQWLLYNGSFTTPHCEENVHWLIYEDIQTCSTLQANFFKVNGTNTNRLIQALNQRVVQRVLTPIVPHPEKSGSFGLVCGIMTAILAVIIILNVIQLRARPVIDLKLEPLNH